MNSFLLLGANGQLASAFKVVLESEGKQVRALTSSDCDLRTLTETSLDVSGADAVINCAAFTAVDLAESQEDEANQVNGHAVGTLATICATAKIPLLHFSTDYVFDGAANAPYLEDAPFAPGSAYGRSKALGERLLMESSADWLLVRTSWVYAASGKNFFRTIAQLLKERPELKVVSDQRGKPTHTTGLAKRSLALLEKGERGVFHITDDGECTWFDFAKAISHALYEARGISSPCKIMPCTTEEFPRPAKRPAYSVLDTNKAERVLGKADHFETWLKRTVEEHSASG